jgi:hypothetical protein
VPTKPLSIEQLMGILRETPSHLDASVEGLAPGRLRTAPEPDAWSANDVLAHLRSCADMWGDDMVRIGVEGHTTIKTVHPRAWIKQTDYPDLDFRDSLRAFTSQREQLLEFLEPLAPETWACAATITVAGRTPIERTLHFYGDRMAAHELVHVTQVQQIVEVVRR